LNHTIHIHPKLASLIVVLLLLPVFAVTPIQAQTGIPREQTIIVGGAWWEPPYKWNPFNHGGAASGTVGLVYEPLYLWIPIKPENERFIPWLARELPTWETTNRVVIKLREEANGGMVLQSQPTTLYLHSTKYQIPSLGVLGVELETTLYQ